ncbi:CocE/NonD family hydrolase [Fontimonas thermophila]|uniref:CocE/NonD family hydrolase n=1 Tax=Fontimonas thermophila TaxID=1076937 RepID=UPI001F29E918|nr:CocE/NonD family hydrolase [Fontimonas thermophila]
MTCVVLLSACDGGSGSRNGGGAALPADETPPRVAVTETRDGTIYRQEISVAQTGDTVVFQVFEPTRLEAGKTYPLVLHGHGYGGSRMTEPSPFAQRLRDAGYYVISIDQRGFGESSGTVRVLSPDFEGHDLIAVLDWAENLPGLRRRGNGEMYVGAYGGSYGGGYQFLLHGADPKHRLRVMAPDITWHDLTYSLNAHGVIKSGYALALSAGGEAGSELDTDPVIRETLVEGASTNEFPEPGFNFFRYHSLRYFCDGVPAGEQNFAFPGAVPDPRAVPPTPLPPADVLLTQGFRDTLFNFNEALANYECLKRAGGDVRLLTHQSGHILPVSLTSIPGAEDALDPFYAAISFPNFQDTGGTRRCGSLDLDDVQFAWFEEKLRGQRGAVDAALSTGSHVCISLAEEDAIAVREVKRGGTVFTIDASTPQLSGVLGAAGSVLGNAIREALLATQPLYTAPSGGAIVAGIPLLAVEISPVGGLGLDECPLPPLHTACDPILFFAIGHRKAGTERWDIIDDQITPLRGFGAHTIEMNGIAERLAENDELALLIYGFHAQYPISWSRDLLLAPLEVSGTVALPLLQPDEIVRDGI